MNCAFDYCLTAPNLKNMLIDAGVIGLKTLHPRPMYEEHYECVIDMSKCHKEKWAEIERHYIEAGCIDFSKKNADGHYGVRRDLTEQEIAELPFWPVWFTNDDEMNWCCTLYNEKPALFASLLFPDITFEYLVFFQDEWDGGYDVKNGVFAKSAEWIEWLESGEAQ